MCSSDLLRWNDRFPALLGLPPAMMRTGTAYEAIGEQLADGSVPFLETEAQIRPLLSGSLSRALPNITAT